MAVHNWGGQLAFFADGWEGVLYAGGSAFNANTGALLWQGVIGWSSTPAVANGVVYVGSGDGSVYALNADTGAFVWKYATGGSVESSPVVANGVVYVAPTRTTCTP